MGKVWGNFIVRQHLLVLTGFVSLAFSSHVFAAPDGSYTGTASGNYFTGSCSPPGVDTALGPVPYSGASVSLNVSGGGSSITMSFSHSNFTLTLSGSQSGSDFLAGIGPNDMDITAQSSGLNTSSNSTVVSISGASLPVVVGAGSIFDSTSNCLSAQIDWNSISFSSLSPSPSPGGSNDQVDPTITPGVIITDPQILNSQVTPMKNDVQNRIEYVARILRKENEARKRKTTGGPKTSLNVRPTNTGIMMDSVTGLNAGDNATNMLFGAWGSYSYTDFENDFLPTAFDGDRHGVMAGADIVLGEKAILGVAVGYENNDIDTTFNLGNQETDGFSIVPYFGYLIDDTWSIDGTFGYTSLDTDQFRTAPGTTTQITSESDSDRWFGALNLNGITYYGNWILSGRLGLLYANHDQDSFVESDGTAVAEFESELGQINIGGEVAYSTGELEPYARVTFEHDWEMTEVGVIGGPQPSFDDDDVLVGAGVRYFGADNISGNLEWSKRVGRDDFDEDNVRLTLRIDF